jgi:hypothetical protein
MRAARPWDAVGPLLVMAGLLLGGCADAPDAPPGTDAREGLEERVVEATEEFRIGLADGDPRYLFGTIHGIAVDGESRIWVADGLAGAIKVFDREGEHLFEFGQVGDGPGDFSNPCCLAFDPDGRLWVWSDGDLARQLRYDVFDVSGLDAPGQAGAPTAAQLAARIRHEQRIQGGTIGALWPKWRMVSDADGNLVHPTFYNERTPIPQGAVVRDERISTPQGIVVRPQHSVRPRHARLYLGPDGTELDRVYLPEVTRDSLGGLAPPPTPGGVRSTHHGPLIRMQLRAHSPRGGFVEGVNMRYEVNWYDDAGELVRVIRRPEVLGPPLAAEERDEAAELLRSTRDARRQRGDPPLDLSVPDRHNPLERLFFDDGGHLWVQRRTAADDPFELADRYGPDGGYLHTVRWPRGVFLYHGAVDGDAAHGVSLDELGVARVVKLRLPPP